MILSSSALVVDWPYSRIHIPSISYQVNYFASNLGFMLTNYNTFLYFYCFSNFKIFVVFTFWNNLIIFILFKLNKFSTTGDVFSWSYFLKIYSLKVIRKYIRHIPTCLVWTGFSPILLYYLFIVFTNNVFILLFSWYQINFVVFEDFCWNISILGKDIIDDNIYYDLYFFFCSIINCACNFKCYWSFLCSN